MCLAAEGGHGGARPQPHIGAVKGRVARAEQPGQRRAGVKGRALVHLGDRDHRSAGDEDADHPLAQAPPPRWLRQTLAGGGHHRKRAADVQVQPLRPDLVDRDFSRPVRARKPARQQLGDLGQMPEPAIGRGRHGGRQVSRAARPKRRYHQAGQRSDHPYLRQPPKRIVVAAKPRALRRNEHIGCSRRLQEPRVGGVGAARPRRRRQHHPAREPGQQRQPCPASPPGGQFVRDEPPDSPHGSRLRTAGSTSQGACPRRGGEGGTTRAVVPSPLPLLGG